MKNPPDWLRAAVADSGTQVLAGARQQADAEAAVKAAILARPEFVGELAAVLATAQVSAWVREHRSSGDLFQAALFPGIPPAMLTSVGRYTPTADMTGAELDKAKAMLLAQTRNARTSADRRQKDFTAFYKQVRPLLVGDRIVADVLADLAAKAA
jgi:hypothetical protein